MVELYDNNGSSLRRARRAWVVQYGNGKVPSENTIKVSFDKAKFLKETWIQY